MYQPEYFFYNTVNSTIDTAFELLKENNCVVVTAEFQTKGRGRNNKTWHGNKGQNLYYTFGVNHSANKIPLYLFQMLGGMAVSNVLNEINIAKKTTFRLKYPNDIYGIDSDGLFKKVSGVISETNFINSDNCSSIIGIGINVNQVDFPKEISQNSTSLKLLNIEIQFDALVEKLTSEIMKMLDKPTVEVFDDWKSLINLNNKKIFLASNSDTVSYQLKNFLEDGRLLVVSDYGTEKIIDNGDSIKYDLH
jgi:BirA family biotin operon repressor/biotin-[acetyl-CoA-carboxylase] ligase